MKQQHERIGLPQNGADGGCGRKKHCQASGSGELSGKNQKGFGFVKIEEKEYEIYISKENSLNALNGDKVLVEIIEEKKENTKKEKKEDKE